MADCCPVVKLQNEGAIASELSDQVLSIRGHRGVRTVDLGHLTVLYVCITYRGTIGIVSLARLVEGAWSLALRWRY